MEEADLMRFPDTGRFKGIAFITFATVRHKPQCAPACLCLGHGARCFPGSVEAADLMLPFRTQGAPRASPSHFCHGAAQGLACALASVVVQHIIAELLGLLKGITPLTAVTSASRQVSSRTAMTRRLSWPAAQYWVGSVGHGRRSEAQHALPMLQCD